jgi:hypothetical protein
LLDDIKAFSGDAPQLTTHLFVIPGDIGDVGAVGGAGVVGAAGVAGAVEADVPPLFPLLQPMIKTNRRAKLRQKTLSRRRLLKQN